jgi:hypothetical protein
VIPKFYPETHTYTHGGRAYPSVTQVLGQWLKVGNYYVNTMSGDIVPADIFEHARDRGNATHKIFELLEKHYRINREHLAGELLP